MKQNKNTQIAMSVNEMSRHGDQKIKWKWEKENERNDDFIVSIFVCSVDVAHVGHF